MSLNIDDELEKMFEGLGLKSMPASDLIVKQLPTEHIAESCEVCRGDCAGANPSISHCPMGYGR